MLTRTGRTQTARGRVSSPRYTHSRASASQTQGPGLSPSPTPTRTSQSADMAEPLITHTDIHTRTRSHFLRSAPEARGRGSVSGLFSFSLIAIARRIPLFSSWDANYSPLGAQQPTASGGSAGVEVTSGQSHRQTKASIKILLAESASPSMQLPELLMGLCPRALWET